jgi:hypothetical protein
VQQAMKNTEMLQLVIQIVNAGIQIAPIARAREQDVVYWHEFDVNGV